MSRLLLLSVGLSSLISTVATAVVLRLPRHRAAAAPTTRVRAEQLVAAGPDSTDRARLLVGPGFHASVSVLSTDGRVRALMGTGGPTTRGGTELETADFVLWAQDGTRIARLGTRNAQGSHAAGVNLLLSDAQGRVRLDLLVAEDGTPAIHMLDADGNVTWSAP
jgi:hypothetical protein